MIDRRVVANPAQIKLLLEAIRKEAPDMEAFFGVQAYAALRPEEALHLHRDDYQRPKEPGAWGWLYLNGAIVEAGVGWSDAGTSTESRGLKHRPTTATRSVPACPQLCAMLDDHIESLDTGSNGRLFVTRRGPGGRYVPTAGNPIPSSTISRVWKSARSKALTPLQVRSPLARVSYHLRHFAVSLWLNAGVPPTLVAEWAGHSLAVLLRIYAKCMDGGEAAAFRRIEAALTQHWETDNDQGRP